ncbi:hypothetical protein HK100_002122, partial [Physocladia obscura]
MGWSAELDTQSGVYYYWNSDTGETTWDRPTGDVSIDGELLEPEQPKQPPSNTNIKTSSNTQHYDQQQQQQDYYNSKEYADWYYATYAAYANTNSAISAPGTADSVTPDPDTAKKHPTNNSSGAAPPVLRYSSAWKPPVADDDDAPATDYYQP